jgi:PleD family two-component response regulator
LNRRLQREWLRPQRDGAPLSLILADIDGFKRCNERARHAGCDRLADSHARAGP